VTDAMVERERAIAEASDSDQTIINYYDNFMKNLERSIIQETSQQYFIDGSTAANQFFWRGLGTMNQFTQTIDSTQALAVARTANAADKFWAPAGSYGGLSMVLGNYGGAQSAGHTWPDNNADPEFDFWSPVGVVWNSTSLNGANHTFADQGEEVISLGIAKMLRNQSENGGPSHLFLGNSLFESYKRAMRDKQRILVNDSIGQINAGFSLDTFRTDEGVQVVNEYQIDPELGYGVNFMDFEMRCVLDRMFQTQGPDYDIKEDHHRMATRNLSTLMMNSPRNLLVLRKVA